MFKNCHILQGRESCEANLRSVDDCLGTEVDPVDPSRLAHLGQICEVRGGRGYQQVSCPGVNLLEKCADNADLRLEGSGPIVSAAKGFHKFNVSSSHLADMILRILFQNSSSIFTFRPSVCM